MATHDDTSNLHRSRRVPRRETSAVVLASAGGGDSPPPTIPPRTLEEAIENARTLLLQLRAMLHCLSDVLLYSDDEDAVMHAEVARSASDWANYAAAELDPVKLKPLIAALQRSGGGTPEDGNSDSSDSPPYQVREPRLVYAA